MKTERAIELLNRISDSQFDGEHGDERREALSMAVRALESNLVKGSDGLVNDLVKDCISRQQAIDALDKHIDTFDAIDKNYLSGLRTAMSILKEMPSAQPETHDKRTETHECDLINRQQAIDAVVSAMIDGADAELVEGVMELLPSAQPVNYGSTKSGSSSQLKLNNDLISRQQAIGALNDEYHGMISDESMKIYQIINWISALPSAQPQRKKGKWINHRNDDGHNIADCEQCGNAIQWFDGDEIPRYCPNCGARMDGESE